MTDYPAVGKQSAERARKYEEARRKRTDDVFAASARRATENDRYIPVTVIRQPTQEPQEPKVIEVITVEAPTKPAAPKIIPVTITEPRRSSYVG